MVIRLLRKLRLLGAKNIAKNQFEATRVAFPSLIESHFEDLKAATKKRKARAKA